MASKKAIIVLGEDGMSEVKMFYSIGAKSDPSGTPNKIECMSEIDEPWDIE